MTPVELFQSVNASRKGNSPSPNEDGMQQHNPSPPVPWGEFLMRFSALSGFLVRRWAEKNQENFPTIYIFLQVKFKK